MDWKVALSTFGLIFVAELGDKTQIAAITLVSKTKAPWAVLLGSGAALCCVSLVAVLFGAALTRYVPLDVLRRIAAGAFIAIGVLMLLGKM